MQILLPPNKASTSTIGAKRNLALFLFLIIILGMTLLQFPLQREDTCRAAVVWSDDFDDGNYDGWTVVDGNFTAEDHTLRANATQGQSRIYFYSPIATGTWHWTMRSVDISSSTFENRTKVYFMHAPLNMSHDSPEYNKPFSVQISPGEQRFIFLRGGTEWDEYKPGFRLTGWQQIDVMRDIEGYLYIWINGSLRMTDFWGPRYETSGIFQFVCPPGAAIDNISVSNTCDFLVTPSDVRLSEETISLVCERGTTTTTSFSLTNYGETIQQVTFVWIGTARGIDHHMEGWDIWVKYNRTESVEVDFEVGWACSPGNYVFKLQLYLGDHREGGELFVTLVFEIHVLGQPFPLGIPFEQWIMMFGYIIYAQIVLLVFILIHRKVKILIPQNPQYIIILTGIFSIVCHLIGHFLGGYCYVRSVGGLMCG
ncbi:MAG: hypothetical protein ACFFDE_12140 [Promethearchaeota archaeon]